MRVEREKCYEHPKKDEILSESPTTQPSSSRLCLIDMLNHLCWRDECSNEDESRNIRYCPNASRNGHVPRRPFPLCAWPLRYHEESSSRGQNVCPFRGEEKKKGQERQTMGAHWSREGRERTMMQQRAIATGDKTGGSFFSFFPFFSLLSFVPRSSRLPVTVTNAYETSNHDGLSMIETLFRRRARGERKGKREKWERACGERTTQSHRKV